MTMPVSLTVGGLARAAGISEWTVRRYARDDLVPYRLDSAGRRLFDDTAVDEVRAVYARRIARRGRRQVP